MGVSKQKRRKKLSSRKGRALLFLFCLLPTICLWAVLISNVIYKSSKGKHKNNKKSSAPAAGAAGAATTAGASVSFEQNVMMSFKNHHVNDHVEAEKQVEELNGDKLTTGHEVIEKIPVTIRYARSVSFIEPTKGCLCTIFILCFPHVFFFLTVDH